MSKADVIEIEGKVVEKLPNAFLRLNLRMDIRYLQLSVES